MNWAQLLLSVIIQIFIIGMIMLWYSYSKRKGHNRADIEDLPIITQIVESIKNKLNTETLLSLETIRKANDLIEKKIDIQKEIVMHSYQLTLDRLVILDKQLSECFWMYLDKPFDRTATSTEWDKLLKLRRLIFDSTLYLDGAIIDSSLDLSITFDTLMKMKRDDINRDEYYRKLSHEISNKYDLFKELSKERYFFDTAEKVIKSTEELIEYYKINNPQ